MTISQTARRLATLSAIALAAMTLTGCNVVTQALNGGESDVFTIEVGNCLNDEEVTGEVTTIPVVDCDKPHDSEIYASIIMDDAEYPGEEATIDFADESCHNEFEGFVGLNYDESIYSYSTLYPTEGSWSGGDREVLCSITLLDENGAVEQVSGSLEGVAE
jgi:hypothetical protein